MGNLSYNTLLKRYKELKNRRDSEGYYYFYANKNQIEKNEKLKNENKELKKQNIELSYLITELLRGKNNG